jgi:hypothetical protein
MWHFDVWGEMNAEDRKAGAEHWHQYSKRQDATWASKRQSEVLLDLFAFVSRSVSVLFIAYLLSWVAHLFGVSVPMPGFVTLLCWYLLAMAFFGPLMVWLRLWSSYIERRFDDIQSHLRGEAVSYYQRSDPPTPPFPLHEQLKRIENLLHQAKEQHHFTS